MTTAEPGRQRSAEALFAAERAQLLGVAYRLLGTMTDAEDVLQDVFERWLRVDRSNVENPAAYLTTMTTRAGIDRLRSARARREIYVGPWLPEPITTSARLEDPAAVAELDESLTIGYLYLLEELKPVERAVYLLHDVFDFSFREVAAMVDREEANCRQLASRARSRLKARRPDEYRSPPADVEADLCHRLVDAVTAGDIERVMALMSEDVVHVSDGGEHHRAARQPVVGRERVARLLVNLAARLPGVDQLGAERSGSDQLRAEQAGVEPSGAEVELRLLRANQQPAVLVLVGGRPLVLVVIELANDLVRRIYAVVNPDKLQSVVGDERPGAAPGD